MPKGGARAEEGLQRAAGCERAKTENGRRLQKLQQELQKAEEEALCGGKEEEENCAVGRAANLKKKKK